MPARSLVSRVAAIAAGGALYAASVSGQQAPVQQRPQFRSATTLVPVDVRVVDRQGRPITDLTAADFTILEDGVPQTVSHFSRHALVAAEPEPGPVRLLRNTRGLDPEPQDHRVFLLLLGRGRLQPPAKGVDAAIDFVRELLLPQDRVAVFAWNRATDFTTDHGRVLALLERFKEEHEEIEALMKLRFSGLAAVYGSSRIPDGIQQRIDAVFEGPEALGVRRVPDAAVAGADRMAEDERRVRELLAGTSQLDVMGAAEAGTLGVSFDEFVDSAVETNQNLANLYTGIEYLRHIAGEKHLIYISEGFLTLRRQEDGDSLAAVAADARVTINPIHTGGLRSGFSSHSGRMSLAQGYVGVGLGARDQRAIADLTGGRASAFQWARDAVARIDQSTRFSYVLGYYPANQDWDGALRKIEIRVNRPGATVMYRRSYFADHELPPLDLREFTSYRRVMSAGNYDRDVPDIAIDATAAYDDTDGHDVTVDMTIAADRLTLVADEVGLRIGHIKIAVFIGDLNENVVGDSWQDMDLKLLPDTYERFLAEGISHQVTLTLPRQPSYAKVVVYDYAADLVGSVIVRIQR